MAFTNKSRRIGTLEQVITCHEDGTILQGEADMYVRIQRDCEKSRLHWYMWYDLSLPISLRAGQSEIQIDFLLICEKGAIIIEVKGGSIDVIEGKYFYASRSSNYVRMKDTPFDQANHYKWALLNHHVLNGDQLFVDYAVAFPHQEMSKTNYNKDLDEKFRLWDKTYQENPDCSIADFCEHILDRQHNNSLKNHFVHVMSENELKDVVEILSPTFVDKSRYSESSLSEVLKWLQIENLDILEGLSKNKRIIIEGGPGTGKTTMAKAFVKRYKGLKGLYLCKNILLQAKVKEELVQEDLYNCEVNTFGRYLYHLSNSRVNDLDNPTTSIVDNILSISEHRIYDYIIIDEAQDIADVGMVPLLNHLASNNKQGLAVGTYLIFYDLEQGFNNSSRRLDEIIANIMPHAAHYKLNENKRVITNKEIIKIANQLLDLEQAQLSTCFDKLCELDTSYFRCSRTSNNKELSIAFRKAIRESADTENTVVLLHSSLQYINSSNDDTSIYDSLVCKPGIHLLDEDDIVNPDSSSIPYTNILKYKGMETHKVILVIPDRCVVGDFSNYIYELYVGFTRAMMELNVIIYTN